MVDLKCKGVNKMTTKEVANICGVADRTVSGNARKAGVVLENGKTHDWTDEEVKRLQLVLIANAQNNNVNASVQVKETSKTVFELGTLANVALTSGNIEAAEQFSKLLIQATTATAQAKQLEAQNQLLLEQNESIKKDALVIAGWAEQRSVLAYSIAHHLNWNLSKRKEVGKQLSVIARQFNHNVGKVTDRDFGEVNAYGADTWALWESRFK